MSVLDDGSPNLTVVDEAFGPHADLYVDVLQVQPNAAAEQIQEAYFERRNELFAVLADIDDLQDSVAESHRRNAERKMDAVVTAVRIFRDPDLRLQYDDLRSQRCNARDNYQYYQSHLHHADDDDDDELVRRTNISVSPNRPHQVSDILPNKSYNRLDDSMIPAFNTSGNTASTLNTTNGPTSGGYASDEGILSEERGHHHIGYDDRGVMQQHQQQQQQLRQQAKKRMKESHRGTAVVSPERNRGRSYSMRSVQSHESETIVSYDDESRTIDEDDTTLMTYEDETFFTVDEPSISDSILEKLDKKPKGLVDRIKMEIIGALDDTARSFGQVLNVFTLQEEEIQQVMGRIDKAKRQISRGIDENTVEKQPKKKSTSPSIAVPSSAKMRKGSITKAAALSQQQKTKAGRKNGRRSRAR